MSIKNRLKNLRKKAGNVLKGAGKTIKNNAKSIGGTIKKNAKKVGGAVKKTTKTTGRVVKNTAKSSIGVAKKVGRVAKKGAKATGRTVKNVAKKVTKTTDFNLNCHFLICHNEADFTDVQVKSWINKRVLLAEKMYDTKPKLKIKSSFSRVKNGNKFLTMEFSTGKDYNAFMNKKFDNISKYFTSGKLNFLVADYWKIAGKEPCGKAFFNFYPGWKKHAVYLRRNCKTTTFPHELGHVFGLMHTFIKGGLCTSKYSKKEGSTKKDGRSNLMDYDRANIVYLNTCQQRVAALTRRRHMTITGKVKYYKLSGFV
ncbi:hypothetical protein [uncultured Algibacter sp.]|uniref:hypothetical protein n=1 Tax=uncultured Algibacter sp. TaxID=298659 RepID=UPI00321695FE